MNEHEKSWTLLLRHNKRTGQAFMHKGWRSFCRYNGIKPRSSCRFKLVQSGIRPVLQLCPNTSNIPEGNSSKPNKKRNVSESEGDEIESEDCSETVPMHQNKILTLDLKPYVFRSCQFVSFKTFVLGFSKFCCCCCHSLICVEKYSVSLHRLQERTGSWKQER